MYVKWILLLVAILVLNHLLGPSFVEWAQTGYANGYFQGPEGVVLLFAVLVVACLVVVIPVSVLAVISGFLFGTEGGVVLCFSAMLTGASLIYLLSRSMLRPRLQFLVSRYSALRSLEQEISEHGLKMICLIRLSPVAPFGLVSYALGLTRVSFSHFLIGTCGSAPGLFAYVYSGALLESFLILPQTFVLAGPPAIALGIGVFATVWLLGRAALWQRRRSRR